MPVPGTGEQVPLPHNDQDEDVHEGREGGDINNHQTGGQWAGEQGEGGAQHQVRSLLSLSTSLAARLPLSIYV